MIHPNHCIFLVLLITMIFYCNGGILIHNHKIDPAEFLTQITIQHRIFFISCASSKAPQNFKPAE